MWRKTGKSVGVVEYRRTIIVPLTRALTAVITFSNRCLPLPSEGSAAFSKFWQRWTIRENLSGPGDRKSEPFKSLGLQLVGKNGGYQNRSFWFSIQTISAVTKNGVFSTFCHFTKFALAPSNQTSTKFKHGHQLRIVDEDVRIQKNTLFSIRCSHKSRKHNSLPSLPPRCLRCLLHTF